jgi:hypothetical protein
MKLSTIKSAVISLTALVVFIAILAPRPAASKDHDNENDKCGQRKRC